MSDIGEAVSVLIDSPTQCPFCDSEEQNPQFEQMELVNDSAALAKNLGGMPNKKVSNPEASMDYDIYLRYWINDGKSHICLNAHHIIPGNASLAKCTEIRKWMAGTTVIKKKFYDASIEKQVLTVKKTQQAAKRRKLVETKYSSYTLYGSPDAEVTYSSIKGRKAIHRDNTVDAKHVTGKINYDVNHARNGIWLPSNNAIAGWSKIKSSNAEDMNADSGPFDECYAFNAMVSTKRQFHDAHPDYSDEVIKKLKELDIEVRNLAMDCTDHNGSQANNNGGAPFPAPHRLASALYTLSLEFSKRLDLNKTDPAEPWITSQLSLIY